MSLFTPSTILTTVQWSIPGSFFVPLDWLMARHTSGAVHNIAYYRAYVWSIGDGLRPLSLFCRGRALTLNFIPYNSGKNSFFDWSILNTFKILSRYVLIWKYHLAFWSILIDLDAQCSSSLIQVFYWKTPFKQPYMLSRNSTSFPINNMSTTYTHQKFYSAPTHFFGNTSFS